MPAKTYMAGPRFPRHQLSREVLGLLFCVEGGGGGNFQCSLADKAQRFQAGGRCLNLFFKNYT